MNRNRRSKAPLFVGIFVLLMFVLGVIVSTQTDGTQAPRAAFDDASPTGGKGLQLLLSRLGYSVSAVYDPQNSVPKNARVWLILDPQIAFSKVESQRLLDWVRAGGTLVYCSSASQSSWVQSSTMESGGIAHLRSTLKLAEYLEGNPLQQRPPAQPVLAPLSLDAISIYRSDVKNASGSSWIQGAAQNQSRENGARPANIFRVADTPGGSIYRFDLGQGRVWVLPDAWLFTNYALAQDDNAVLVTNLIRAHEPSGAVFFDQRQHDDNFEAPRPDSIIARLQKPPFSTAIWQLFAALLLFWAFAGRRLGRAVEIERVEPVTRASQFAHAMGALFQKANRPNAAATVVGENFRRELARRLGLSPAESDEILAQRAHELCAIPVQTIDKLLLHSRAPLGDESQILRDAQEMQRVLDALKNR